MDVRCYRFEDIQKRENGPGEEPVQMKKVNLLGKFTYIHIFLAVFLFLFLFISADSILHFEFLMYSTNGNELSVRDAASWW